MEKRKWRLIENLKYNCNSGQEERKRDSKTIATESPLIKILSR
jgi:hypothetical protein